MVGFVDFFSFFKHYQIAYESQMQDLSDIKKKKTKPKTTNHPNMLYLVYSNLTSNTQTPASGGPATST